MNLNELADRVHLNAKEHGFHNFEEPTDVFIANQCNNMHAEITELWDAFRAGESLSLCDKSDAMIKLGLKPLSCAEEELADIIIRALDVSRRLGLDIVSAIESKHSYNTTRPYKHGKKN